MQRAISGSALAATGLLAALCLLGSDRWLAASYDGAIRTTLVEQAVGDEAYWLDEARSRPVVAAVHAGTIVPPRNRTLEVGTRLSISGIERMSLEIVSATAVPADSGLVDGQGRPLILVIARERGNGERTLRLLVEADQAPVPLTEKAL